MGRAKAIDALSKEHRTELESRLIQGKFTGYQALTDWLNSLGYRISKTATHNYGKKLERKVQAIQDAELAAKIIAESVAGNKGNLSTALISLSQTMTLDFLMGLSAHDFEPEDIANILPKLLKAVSDISRSEREHQRYQQEVASRIKAEIAQVQGDAATLDKVRSHIMQVYGLDE